MLCESKEIQTGNKRSIPSYQIHKLTNTYLNIHAHTPLNQPHTSTGTGISLH